MGYIQNPYGLYTEAERKKKIQRLKHQEDGGENGMLFYLKTREHSILIHVIKNHS